MVLGGLVYSGQFVAYENDAVGRVYLPSPIVAPIPFECESIMVVVEEVSVEGARAILEGEFISAVGHEATAKFFSKFGERMQGVELGEDEVERLFREGRARFLKITVNRLRTG